MIELLLFLILLAVLDTGHELTKIRKHLVGDTEKKIIIP